jgi:hypothetical protein
LSSADPVEVKHIVEAKSKELLNETARIDAETVSLGVYT